MALKKSNNSHASSTKIKVDPNCYNYDLMAKVGSCCPSEKELVIFDAKRAYQKFLKRISNE